MARIRSVKPEVRDSLVVASWPRDVRLFWVYLWMYLDDEGRGLDMPKRIAGECFPHDDDIDASDIDAWLNMMSRGIGDAAGPICRFSWRGKRYVHAVNWGEHQKPNRPTPSRLPPCPIHESPQVTPLSEELMSGSTDSHEFPPVGAEELGAEEQQQRAHESLTAKRATINAGLIRVVTEATGATDSEAEEIIRAVAAEGRHRSLGPFIKRLAGDGDLKPYLGRIRDGSRTKNVRAALASASKQPPCVHGVPGGNLPHPVNGRPICASCRANVTARSA